MKFSGNLSPQLMSATTMTVGEAIEALSKFDRTDRLVASVSMDATGEQCPIESIKKIDCRKVAIKVSDE
jgi:hypothetical protein